MEPDRARARGSLDVSVVKFGKDVTTSFVSVTSQIVSTLIIFLIIDYVIALIVEFSTDYMREPFANSYQLPDCVSYTTVASTKS